MNVRIFWVRAMKCMCAQTRPRFILSSEGVFGGMEFEPMLTPREKSPLPENVPRGGTLILTGWFKEDAKPEARCPARRMLVNAREWRNNASWSGVAYTTSGSKARSNARWRGRSLAFKTRWRMCFSYKSFTFICFHANFSSFSFVDRQNTYSCKSDLFAN